MTPEKNPDQDKLAPPFPLPFPLLHCISLNAYLFNSNSIEGDFSVHIRTPLHSEYRFWIHSQTVGGGSRVFYFNGRGVEMAADG